MHACSIWSLHSHMQARRMCQTRSIQSSKQKMPPTNCRLTYDANPSSDEMSFTPPIHRAWLVVGWLALFCQGRGAHRLRFPWRV